MKHTPAPWKLAGATTISNADATACIAHVSTFSIEQSEADANAALIAAAPELLQALIKAERELAYHASTRHSRKLPAIRAAIAKARPPYDSVSYHNIHISEILKP